MKMKVDDLVGVLKIIRDLKAIGVRCPEAAERIGYAIHQLENVIPMELVAPLVQREEVQGSHFVR